MKYFEDLVQGGEWDEVERYLSGFTKLEDNRYSMKIFEIRKQKYLRPLIGDRLITTLLLVPCCCQGCFFAEFAIGVIGMIGPRLWRFS